METKLLPCPFCESDNCWTHEVWNRYTDHAQGYYVECYDCGAMKGAMIYNNGTWDGFYKTEAEAIEAWNTRHERTESPNRMGILPCGAIWDGKAYCSKCGARVKEMRDAD